MVLEVWILVTWHQLSLPLWLSAVSLSLGDIFVIEPLDYEVSHEYYITIEATDGGLPPLSDMATVNINLTDVNDNRPAFSQDVYTAVVSEDTEQGKTVMMVRIYVQYVERFLHAVGTCLTITHITERRFFLSFNSVVIYSLTAFFLSAHYSPHTLITYLHLWQITIWWHS